MNERVHKFLLRLPKALHQQLRSQAKTRQISLNQLIVEKVLENDIHPDIPIKAILNTFKDQVVGIALFGSTARGTQTRFSDVDLLIVLKDKVSLERELYRRWDNEVAAKVKSKVEPQFVHLPELNDAGGLWLEVAMDGRVIYDPSCIVRDHVQNLKNQIAEGRYARRWSHGHPYWRKKK